MIQLFTNQLKVLDQSLSNACKYRDHTFNFQVDVNMLEKVQRRITKKIQEINHLEYPQCLEVLNLAALEIWKTKV